MNRKVEKKNEFQMGFLRDLARWSNHWSNHWTWLARKCGFPVFFPTKCNSCEAINYAVQGKEEQAQVNAWWIIIISKKRHQKCT